MGAGLQVFGEAKEVLLDTSDFVTRIIGMVKTKENVSGSVSAPGLMEGTPFCFVYYPAINLSERFDAPEVSISGQVLSWTAGSKACQLIYGVL